jgi:hypothetical protein
MGKNSQDVDLYEEQLARWSKLELASVQRREIDRTYCFPGPFL